MKLLEQHQLTYLPTRLLNLKRTPKRIKERNISINHGSSYYEKK
jgi:hypothetical protein